MATAKITKRSVDTATEGFLWDSELKGFGLKTTQAGAKSYVFQYRMGGRETHARRYTIGAHGSPWTPSSAREEAERLSLLVKRGVDPREHTRERRRQAVELAFPSYAERFLERYVRPEWPGSYEFAESILRLHITPHLHRMALPELTRADVTNILDQLPAHQTALRRNVYAVLRRLLRWAVGRGDLDRNPIDGFEPPAGPPSRDRVLDDQELRMVWQRALSLGFPFGPLIRLLIVTGQRREEVSALRWEELDRERKLWALPGTRSKNGRAHLVPLSALAVSILDECAAGESWPRTGLVFTTTGHTAVSGHSRAKRRLDLLIRSECFETGQRPPAAWRLHDLRRTLATGFQRLGVRFEVTEAVLNHQSGARSGVAGIYQRHDWATEKRFALELWAQHIEKVSSSDEATNVVPMPIANGQISAVA